MLPRRRPSPALVIACIALFVALGGTGYAALTLPKNSIKGKQLAPRSVGSSEAHNLTAKDFRKGERAKLRGPKGETGPGAGAGTEALQLVAAASGGNCANNNPPPTGAFCRATDGSGWSNYGGAYEAAAFYKDGSGLVHLQGGVKGVLNDRPEGVVFYLPPGYRPPGIRRFATVVGNTTPGFIEIGANGAVTPWRAGPPVAQAFEADFLPLDGIVFRP